MLHPGLSLHRDRPLFAESPTLDDRVAFAIAGNGAQDLLRAKTGSLEFPRAVATARKFGLGNHFKSLADEFGMSPTAMAIRINELDLVSY